MTHYIVVDVNGDEVAGPFDDEKEAEVYADRGEAGLHVIPIRTRTATRIRPRSDLDLGEGGEDISLFEVDIPTLILTEREISELADKLMDWACDDVAGSFLNWLEDRAAGNFEEDEKE